MKNIFETFKRSFSDHLLYQAAAESPLRDGLRYYAKAAFLLALCATVAFAITLVPKGVRFINEDAPLLVKKYYPAHLEISINKGEASINSPQPYFIPGNRETLDALSPDSSLENILVIDTRGDFNKIAFEEYKTFALLTKNDLVTRSERGKITIQSLREFPEMVITEGLLAGFVERVRGAVPIIVILSVLAMLSMLFVGYLLYLVPLLLFALIPFFLAWVKNIPLSYGGAYKMSIYAVVPGLVLKTFFNISGFFFVPAYLSLLVFVLIIFINMKKMKI